MVSNEGNWVAVVPDIAVGEEMRTEKMWIKGFWLPWCATLL